MYRDKTYVLTRQANGEELLFNVTGNRHPDGFVYASLKYVNGDKWTQGYAAARQFLAGSYPQFTDEYIRVPTTEITDVFHPQARWLEIERGVANSDLHQEARELGRCIRHVLDIPPTSSTEFDSEFGVTDSLLWGDGHAKSDIDLVVVGRENAARLVARAKRLYYTVDFQRPDPHVMTEPYGMQIPEWPWLLDRKQHMGQWRGRLFSLRVMPDLQEFATQPSEEPIEGGPTDPIEIEFRIDDDLESLYFPSTYRDDRGNELVDYSVVYEGVFRKGEVVRCRVQPQRVSYSSGEQIDRFIIDGPCRLASVT